MIRADIRVDTDVLDAIRETAQDAPQRMSRAYSRAVSGLRTQLLNDLQQEPGPPQYPITTRMTPRQRRAFWATNGFGRGIPTQRSGALAAGYDVELLERDNGGLLQITNDAPYAPFVVGELQQGFHADTGWQPVDVVAARYEEVATDVLAETWLNVVEGTQP